MGQSHLRDKMTLAGNGHSIQSVRFVPPDKDLKPAKGTPIWTGTEIMEIAEKVTR